MFTGFKPAIDACQLTWDEYPIEGVTFNNADRCQITDVWHPDRKPNKAQWARITKNIDWSTGPLALPFARTALSLTCSRLLASLAPSAALPRSWESE